jgi:SAM-dependent methyltransferase
MALVNANDEQTIAFAHLDVRKMPAHWLMARLGKRVLRPGGVETTRWLIEQGGIAATDEVVEFAPGLGVTAARIVARRPTGYVGVERDETARDYVLKALRAAGYGSLRARVLQADASRVPLPGGSATVVIGEAMLSMQPASKKRAIVDEAHRLLRPGGRYLIHELALQPEAIDPAEAARIEQDLSANIHVGVRIGTPGQWKGWIEEAGFAVERVATAPMRLLEPARLVRDEGIAGTARFLLNVLRTPGAPRRMAAVRGTFRRNRRHLCAVAIVAKRG